MQVALGEIKLGDFDNYNNGIYLFVDDNSTQIKTVWQGTNKGIFIDPNADYYQFGVQAYYNLKVDNAGIIQVEQNGSPMGLYIDFNNHQYYFGQTNGFSESCGVYLDSPLGYSVIGDYFSHNANTYFGVDDNNTTLFTSGNLEVSTSSGTSGKHLKIRVGGTDYVIELKNP